MTDRVVLKGLTRESTNEEIRKAAFDLVWEIRFMAMATEKDGKPEARVFDMTLLDDGNIYFIRHQENLPMLNFRPTLTL